MVTGGGTIRNYTVALMITTMIGLSAIIVFGGSESSEAESEAEEAPVYSGYCGDNVTFGFDPSTGEFTLGGSGAMINYRNEERPWYSYKEEIRSVNIGTSVTSIGYFAFCDCTALTSVIIPDSVTQIWYAAFMGCTALTSVEIPDSVTELQRSTFERCTKLTSITIPDSVIKISSAFRDCTALTSVEIPDSVTFLGGTFYNCTSLTSVTIPDSVTTIEYCTFYNCSSLESISVGEGNAEFCSADGVLFNKAMTDLIQYPLGRPDAVYRIPDTITNVYGSAFSNSTSLNYIVIPDSVKTLGFYTFSGCTALKSIVIPDSVTTVRDHAFKGCKSLASIYISESITAIGSKTFDGNFYEADAETGLEPTATSLRGSSFKNIDGKWIKQTNSPSEDLLKDFGKCGDDVTYSFDALTGTLTICGTGQMESYFGVKAPWYSYKDSVLSVVIGDSVTSVGAHALEWCASLTSIVLPDSVTSVGDSAFGGCTSLASIGVGGNNTAYCSVKGILFSKDMTVLILCPMGIGQCDIPSSVTTIGDDAFYGTFYDTDESELEPTAANLAGFTFWNAGGKWIKRPFTV